MPFIEGAFKAEIKGFDAGCYHKLCKFGGDEAGAKCVWCVEIDGDFVLENVLQKGDEGFFRLIQQSIIVESNILYTEPAEMIEVVDAVLRVPVGELRVQFLYAAVSAVERAAVGKFYRGSV